MPESLLIGFLGGKQEVTRLAVERALRDSLPDALACVASEAISDSERIESSSDELIKSFSLSAPFTYRVGVDMPAKLEFISPYNEMVVTVPTSSSPDSEAQKACLLCPCIMSCILDSCEQLSIAYVGRGSYHARTKGPGMHAHRGRPWHEERRQCCD